MSLTVGFTCTCLLVSFLISESNVDSFHSKKDRIYEVSSNNLFGDGRVVFTFRETHDYLANYPEVENGCQVSDVQRGELTVEDEAHPLKIIAVDTSFFSMFDFPIVAGSGAITSGGILLSSEKAKQLFGTVEVVGKIVSMRGGPEYETAKLLTITGVVGETVEKSHLRFDAVTSLTLFENVEKNNLPGGANYVLLREGANPVDFMAKYNQDPLRPSMEGPGKMEFALEPLTRAYFFPANTMAFMQKRSESFIKIGWVVCSLILFMACFNFVNLFLLSMQERRRETGIRKTLGISLWQTMRSVAVEATVFVGISVVLSALLTYALIPVFNEAFRTNIDFSYASRIKVLAILVSIVMALMILVVTLTTIRHRQTLPVSMMRNVSAKVRFSKIFFTMQFFVSITLCVCSITIIKQMKFIESSPIGFNRNILQLNTPRKQSAERVTEFKNRLLQIAGVEHVAQSSGNPISGNMIVAFTYEDKPMSAYMFEGDEDFVKTLDLQLVEGRLELQDKGDKLVNESLVKMFNLKDPIGMQVPGLPKAENQRIVGVVKDFTCVSFKTEIPPVIIGYKTQSKILLIDHGQADIGTLLPKLKTAWGEFYSDHYFDFRVIQQELMKKYSEETLFYKVVLSASITSMIISCFGLFALSWAVVRSRAKEMSIRKVFGASVTDILRLLGSSFAKRLALAFALATPVGYYLMDAWLSRFVYKVTVNGWIFIVAGGILATITVVTLAMQLLKASLSSPLNEIRE